MAHNISPSPYGFTSTFCQHFWKFIMNDLKALFDDFHTGRLNTSTMSYSLITRVPKSYKRQTEMLVFYKDPYE